MKSIYLLMYKAEENVIEMRARDFHSNYMTAVTILDDDTYLGAENSYNLFTVRKNSDVAADEDRNRLEVRHRSSDTALMGCFPVLHGQSCMFMPLSSYVSTSCKPQESDNTCAVKPITCAATHD